MIDEYFDNLVDRLCRLVPAIAKPWSIGIANSALGWRMQLYFGTLGRNIAALFSKVNTEEKVDLAMREGSEQIDDGLAKMGLFFREQMILLARLDARGQAIRLWGALFLLLLSVLGVAYTGQSGMGVMAASLCLLFVSTAIESGYAPLCGGIRQTYLASTLLRTLSIGLMMIHYFFSYAAKGLPSNVVLQSAMAIMLVIHGVLFIALVLLNTRQPLFLRALAGVTGAVPALTAASAVALCASCLFGAWPLPLSGALSALGAILAFMGDELTNLKNLGGIRLKYHAIWVCLLMTGGFALMLAGVWTYCP